MKSDGTAAACASCGQRRPLMAAIALAGLFGAPVQAAEYRPPTGFNDHTWGEHLSAFHGLKLWHANQALLSPGKVNDAGVSCTAHFRAMAPTSPPELYYTCESNPQGEGNGSFAVAEYYFNQDRNPWVAQGIQLATISYLFCAGWQGEYAPKDVKKRLTLCGVRLAFGSDTPKELVARASDYRSNFDRILRELIARFGEPPGYVAGGRITIESGDLRLTTPEKAAPESVRYRWCGLTESALKLRPNCTATVTLVFETASGRGTVLYAAPPMYDYADARHRTGEENDELYVLLYGGQLAQKEYESYQRNCTGTLICKRGTDSMSAKELRSYQP